MTRNANIRLLLVLVAVGTLLASGPVGADAGETARRLERAKASEPELIAFLKEMPKGADLHNHVSGAVYAETRLDAAIRAGVFFDTLRCTFVRDSVRTAIPARLLAGRNGLAARYLDAVSMRGHRPGEESGHDHFFNTFRLFGNIPSSALSRDEALAEVVLRARAQNVQYLELMTSTVPGEALEAATTDPPPIDDMEAALATLRPRFPALLAASKSFLDQRDTELAKLVGVPPPVSGTGGPINARYIFTVGRISDPVSFFTEMACAMALSQADARIAAVNIAQPEDDLASRRDFDRQMEIIDFLWNRLGHPRLTLHAGELTLDNSPVEVMRSRIRRTIERGHARRIGHGVSIAWEDDLPGLLAEMRRDGIAVEICLTSNAGILGVSGKAHPFNLYRHAGIPLTLNTDDEGVNRSNLTMEFVRAVEAYDLSYAELKDLARNSLEYSFLPGASLYEDGDYSRIRHEFRGVRKRAWTPDDAACRAMESSEKAAVQVRLERAFAEFEK
jgi:adenosine deaminase